MYQFIHVVGQQGVGKSQVIVALPPTAPAGQGVAHA